MDTELYDFSKEKGILIQVILPGVRTGYHTGRISGLDAKPGFGNQEKPGTELDILPDTGYSVC